MWSKSYKDLLIVFSIHIDILSVHMRDIIFEQLFLFLNLNKVTFH